jgi:uncharacterized protein YutE (UPF0331/DUF86 family)
VIDPELVARKALLITRDLVDLVPLARTHASATQLARIGVYDDEFGRRIAGCAGLRDRIAHEYDEIDPRRVHEALAAAVVDIPAYLRAVDGFVKRAAGGAPAG